MCVESMSMHLDNRHASIHASSRKVGKRSVHHCICIPFLADSICVCTCVCAPVCVCMCVLQFWCVCVFVCLCGMQITHCATSLPVTSGRFNFGCSLGYTYGQIN